VSLLHVLLLESDDLEETDAGREWYKSFTKDQEAGPPDRSIPIFWYSVMNCIDFRKQTSFVP